jgi:hypothetical protein
MSLVSDQRSAPPPADPARTGAVSLAGLEISRLIEATEGLKKKEEGRCARDIVLSYFVMSLRFLTDSPAKK